MRYAIYLCTFLVIGALIALAPLLSFMPDWAWTAPDPSRESATESKYGEVVYLTDIISEIQPPTATKSANASELILPTTQELISLNAVKVANTSELLHNETSDPASSEKSVVGDLTRQFMDKLGLGLLKLSTRESIARLEAIAEQPLKSWKREIKEMLKSRISELLIQVEESPVEIPDPWIKPGYDTEPLAVHVYPPDDLLLFTRCSHLLDGSQKESKQWDLNDTMAFQHTSDDKHNADFFFVRAITSPTFVNTPPEDAKLFVIPGMCSQSMRGKCGNHEENINQLGTYLQASKWFERYKGVDHFLLCDRHYNSIRKQKVGGQAIFKNIIGANFETQHYAANTLGVGYTTTTSLYTACPLSNSSTSNNALITDRKHVLAAAFSLHSASERAKTQSEMTPGNAMRDQLTCDWRWGNSSKPLDGMVLSVPGKPREIDRLVCDRTHQWDKGSKRMLESLNLPRPFSQPVDKCNAAELAANSRIVLSPAGDTPTTDRIFNNFETETPTGVIHSEMEAILGALPFQRVIPWRRLLIPLQSEESERTGSLLRSGLAVPSQKLMNVQRWMRLFRSAVLWHINESVVYLHTLNEAQTRADENVEGLARGRLPDNSKTKISSSEQTIIMAALAARGLEGAQENNGKSYRKRARSQRKSKIAFK